MQTRRNRPARERGSRLRVAPGERDHTARRVEVAPAFESEAEGRREAREAQPHKATKAGRGIRGDPEAYQRPHTELHAQTHEDTYAVNDVAYTGDGKSLAVATDELLWTFNASSYADGPYYNFTGWFEDPWSIQGVDWSPDGARLLMWTITAFVVIDVASGDVVAGDEFAAGVSEGTWSPSGAKYAVVLGNGNVRVYDLAPGELELQFKAHDVGTSIDWSYHEQYLATGGETPRLAVWRLDY